LDLGFSLTEKYFDLSLGGFCRSLRGDNRELGSLEFFEGGGCRVNPLAILLKGLYRAKILHFRSPESFLFPITQPWGSGSTVNGSPGHVPVFVHMSWNGMAGRFTGDRRKQVAFRGFVG
jgi:hypothetical protein